jgi:hypothetical protein
MRLVFMRLVVVEVDGGGLRGIRGPVVGRGRDRFAGRRRSIRVGIIGVRRRIEIVPVGGRTGQPLSRLFHGG